MSFPFRAKKLIQLIIIILVFAFGYYLGHQKSKGSEDDGQLASDATKKSLLYIKACDPSSSNNQYSPCLRENNVAQQSKILGEDLNYSHTLWDDFGRKMIDLIILIPSAVSNEPRRKALRETWLQLRQKNNSESLSIKHYFIVGTENVSAVQEEKIIREQAKFKDIMILTSCKDEFSQLTKKLLYSYLWLTKTTSFKYLLKVDDDSFVRLDELSKEIRKTSISDKKLDGNSTRTLDGTTRYDSSNLTNQDLPKEMLYWGYFDGHAPVFKSGKWSEGDWFLCNQYLPYALGGGYIISSDIVELLAGLSPYLKLYANEDVSLGVWLAPFANIKRKHDRRFDTEATSRGCSNQHLISHHLTIYDIYSRYNNLITRKQYCSSEHQIRFSYEYNWTALPSNCCKRVFKDN